MEEPVLNLEDWGKIRVPGLGCGAFYARKRGSGHVAGEKPCQDYCIARKIAPGLFVAAVADGHGGEAYTRSDVGSRLACEELARLAEEICAAVAGSGASEEALVAALSGRAFKEKLVGRWRQAVLRDDGTHPMEQGGRREIIRRYGTTLLFAAVTERHYVLGQLGDGAVLLSDGQGGAQLLKRHSPKVGSKTSSLASERGLYAFFTEVYERRFFDHILLSTDGIYDKLDREDSFLRYARALAAQVREREVPERPFTVEDIDVSERTSDDCTVVLVYPEREISGEGEERPSGGLETRQKEREFSTAGDERKEQWSGGPEARQKEQGFSAAGDERKEQWSGGPEAERETQVLPRCVGAVAGSLRLSPAEASVPEALKKNGYEKISFARVLRRTVLYSAEKDGQAFEIHVGDVRRPVAEEAFAAVPGVRVRAAADEWLLEDGRAVRSYPVPDGTNCFYELYENGEMLEKRYLSRLAGEEADSHYSNEFWLKVYENLSGLEQRLAARGAERTEEFLRTLRIAGDGTLYGADDGIRWRSDAAGREAAGEVRELFAFLGKLKCGTLQCPLYECMDQGQTVKFLHLGGESAPMLRVSRNLEKQIYGLWNISDRPWKVMYPKEKVIAPGEVLRLSGDRAFYVACGEGEVLAEAAPSGGFVRYEAELF